MTAAVLAGYAVLAALALPRLLGRATWTERAPRLAIAMWQAAGVSAVASALLAALTVAVPTAGLGHTLTRFFLTCAAALTTGSPAFPPFATAVPSMTGGLVAMAAAGLVAGRMAWCGGRVVLGARRERRRHVEGLALLGRHDGDLGAIVVDYDERLAYCVPGRHGHTVITTAALHYLTAEQVAAVLAHERAHLRGRHHLVLAAAETLARAFPGVPLFERSRAEQVRLVELLADDVAARRHPRVHLAAALVSLATGRAPAFTLGAGGQTALTRVRRMLHPQAPLGRTERLSGLLAVVLLLGGPAAVAFLPALTSFVTHCCHTLLGS